MVPFDFKARFVAALPPMPPGLELHWDEFVEFEPSRLSALSEDDRSFLTSNGLPRAASPFLAFAAYSAPEIAERVETFAVPGSYFPIGHNGSGDIIAIELTTREIVYFNHDNENLRVFINTTLRQFAECLCVYQEHLRDDTMRDCLAAIASADAPAAMPATMWYNEITAESS
jgi:hypothetical protein